MSKKDWTGSQKIADLIAKKPKGELGKGMSHYLNGQISQGQGRWERAIEEYKLALADIPGLVDALKNMAVCYEGLNKRADMHAYIDEFSAKNPNLYFPSLFKSQVFSMSKEWDKAISILNKGVAKWPDVPQFHEMLAAIYSGNNEESKAISAYQLGLEKNPGSERLGGLLATIYEGKKDYDSAVKVYESVINKNPKADIAVNNLVSLLLDYYEGKDNLEKAVKLSKRFENSSNSYLLDTYGWALFKNEDIKEAVLVLERAVSKSPKVAVFKYHLGEAYHAFDNDSDAIRLLEGALLLGEKEQGGFVEKDKTKALLASIKTAVAL
jgi:tetratricopeptide (TPR) repeat protein